MKKAARFVLAILLFLGGLSSCHSTEETTSLLYGKIHTEDEVSFFEDIDEDGLKNLESNPLSERFLLYYYEPTCSGCKTFSPILKKAAKEKNLLLYGLNALSLSSDSEFKKKQYNTPTLLYFEEGTIKKTFSSKENEQAFTNYDSFISLYEKNFKDPKALYLPLSRYEELKNGNSNYVVEFINQTCQDCQWVHSSFLNDYLLENDVSLYLLDKSEVLATSEGDDQSVWNNFKLENGLCGTYQDGSKNPFGFDVGFTPTFQARSGKTILDAEIPYETYDSESKTIVRKYYEDDLEIGTSFASSSEYRNNRKNFYNEKLKDFFDYYSKKVY